ncbi:DapH/DapD/GlmU-related protein [uncultured Duncaniella sp.]|uniref:acyltransferase n=1 Tax=uncultured Duncaniella sp. TaxID=2768039 RepID=UPI0025DD1C49|nr:DapH/DapD/GlmU-related protein [uncultured Duncaniella sp.]
MADIEKITNDDFVAGKPRVKRERSLKRYWRMILLKTANILPINKFTRANIYRMAGVSIEKGVVRMGKVHMDTIHPEDVIIGNGSVIADGVHLITHYMDVKNMREFAYFRGQIRIGRYCYIGTNTIFTKGVTVGDGAIIGAGSVVNKDIPPYEVWAGVPAKCICKRYSELSDIPKPEEIKLK